MSPLFSYLENSYPPIIVSENHKIPQYMNELICNLRNISKESWLFWILGTTAQIKDVFNNILRIGNMYQRQFTRKYTCILLWLTTLESLIQNVIFFAITSLIPPPTVISLLSTIAHTHTHKHILSYINLISYISWKNFESPL